jgi:hypothetical protein
MFLHKDPTQAIHIVNRQEIDKSKLHLLGLT